jgi:hypothetical protein
VHVGACRLSREVRPGSLPLLSGGREAGTMAQAARRTGAIAVPSPHDEPVYGCSKNAPDPATSCHFSGRPVRRLGGEYRDSSRSGAGT